MAVGSNRWLGGWWSAMKSIPFVQVMWKAKRSGIDTARWSERVATCQVINGLLCCRIAPEALLFEEWMEPTTVFSDIERSSIGFVYVEFVHGKLCHLTPRVSHRRPLTVDWKLRAHGGWLEPMFRRGGCWSSARHKPLRRILWLIAPRLSSPECALVIHRPSLRR